jgi:hypothetical protein
MSPVSNESLLWVNFDFTCWCSGSETCTMSPVSHESLCGLILTLLAGAVVARRLK